MFCFVILLHIFQEIHEAMWRIPNRPRTGQRRVSKQKTFNFRTQRVQQTVKRREDKQIIYKDSDFEEVASKLLSLTLQRTLASPNDGIVMLWNAIDNMSCNHDYSINRARVHSFQTLFTQPASHHCQTNQKGTAIASCIRGCRQAIQIQLVGYRVPQYES